MALARKNIILDFYSSDGTLTVHAQAFLKPDLVLEDAKVVWSKVAKATELTELPLVLSRKQSPTHGDE